MDEMAKATISVGDKTITFEGPTDFVSGEVSRYVRPTSAQADTATIATTSRLTDGGEAAPPSEEHFTKLKSPHGHSETVAVLAFCLAERGIPEFSEEDIKKAYLRAKVRPPKVISQAIRDAKNNFDYIESGSKRGTYRLSNHGDRTVRFDLPRSRTVT